MRASAANTSSDESSDVATIVWTLWFDARSAARIALGYPAIGSKALRGSRALVVRAYLIDRGVKSRIDVGAFLGDDERVDILVPNT